MEKVIAKSKTNIRLGFKMLEGKRINLRLMEKDDTSLLFEIFNKPEILGEYNPIKQISRTDIENASENTDICETQIFIIEKKDGSKIGFINHFNVIWNGIGKLLTIAYCLLPTQRGNGYCTEAAQILVDYLFLCKEIECIQATTHIKNIASQKVLEKIGFKKEGILRKRFYIRGDWQDQFLFSIIKNEWKEPKIPKKTV
jgi:RimJ/RimL family protein N-acetyltransferase